nr:DUF2235 domain-containing protein [Grimontia sedimenti]
MEERALEAVLPQGVTIQKFQSQLASGEYVLLSDAPVTPALKSTTDSMGDKVWLVNPDAESSFSPEAKSALTSRTKAKGLTSRSGSESQAPAEAPYTPEDKVEEKQEKPAQDYEYLFEVACSEEVLASEVGCQFALGKTPKEASIVSWETKPSEMGTVFSAKATDDKPRKLIAKVASAEKGVSNQPPVKLKPKGTDAVREAFIPVIPALQLGDCLGFPTEGYFYHFHEKKLVQEYKILGEGRWAFQATRSTPFSLNTENGLNKYQGAILLYWKIDSKVVTDQHLVYLDEPITQEQLGNVSDEWLNENGVEIDVPTLLGAMKAATADEKPYQPKTCNAPVDVVYEHKERLLEGSTLKAINNERLVESGLPVVNIKKLQNNKFTIGVFFDGTGNNLENDKYKEVRGNASRTNVARLFEAYPEKEGEIAKIYVSGIGTVDFDDAPRAVMEKAIDEGDDLNTLAMMTAIYDSDGKTSAYVKWTSLLKQLRDIIYDLENAGSYSEIKCIEFDVFGFSRGAALARHFVNAAQAGFPDYQNLLVPPGSGRSEVEKASRFNVGIVPHLLGNENALASSVCTYNIDQKRTVKIRFVGLFDTVGSFGKAGDKDEGSFKLSLGPDCAKTVYHITAYHEYRKNFPLTSLKVKDTLPDNFYEEVFPGAHADVGGGYPNIEQYDKSGLPDRYGTPMIDSYNRELVKTLPVPDDERKWKFKSQARGISDEDYGLSLARQETTTWNLQCKSIYKTVIGSEEYRHHGQVKHHDGMLYYYHLQPITTGLQGLSLERMYQQAEVAGIKWNKNRYDIPTDYGKSSELKQLSAALNVQGSGTINQTLWANDITPIIMHCVHRPHDINISIGYDDFVMEIANKPNQKASGELYRETYDND